MQYAWQIVLNNTNYNIKAGRIPPAIAQTDTIIQFISQDVLTQCSIHSYYITVFTVHILYILYI